MCWVFFCVKVYILLSLYAGFRKVELYLFVFYIMAYLHTYLVICLKKQKMQATNSIQINSKQIIFKFKSILTVKNNWRCHLFKAVSSIH